MYKIIFDLYISKGILITMLCLFKKLKKMVELNMMNW